MTSIFLQLGFFVVSHRHSATSFWVKKEDLLAQFVKTLFLMVGWSKLHPNNQPQKSMLGAELTAFLFALVRDVSYTRTAVKIKFLEKKSILQYLGCIAAVFQLFA